MTQLSISEVVYRNKNVGRRNMYICTGDKLVMSNAKLLVTEGKGFAVDICCTSLF
jgi:hypothetical protein